MEQAQLTLEGMKQGVRDCDTFLLILTRNVLTRWFCQQEILTAIEEGTPIQLLVEENAASGPQIAAILTSYACTAHRNKHFAGNLPALYLNTWCTLTKWFG